MAKYTIDCGCGHTITEQLYGSSSERKRRIAWRESADCPACWKARKENDEENQRQYRQTQLNDWDRQGIKIGARLHNDAGRIAEIVEIDQETASIKDAATGTTASVPIAALLRSIDAGRCRVQQDNAEVRK